MGLAMISAKLGRADLFRGVLKIPRFRLRNRHFEQNPILNDGEVSLFARPGRRAWLRNIGEGPIRGHYSEPGVFGGDVFVVSGLDLYRITNTGTVVLIGTIGLSLLGFPSMAATAPIGDIPAHLFIADGGILWCYTEDGFAKGILEADGTGISNGDEVRIGDVYYEFTTGSVDAGTPDGTSGNPWLVARGALDADAIGNLFHAINASGTPGTSYSSDLLSPHEQVTASAYTAAELVVAARLPGIAGNAIVTSETSAGLSWGDSTLEDGGSPSLLQVPVPDDVGAISVVHLKSYVLVVPAQSEDINGRCYWIAPGETTIDPFDFFTAEKNTDAVLQAVVYSDIAMILGETSTEGWLPSGDPEAPWKPFTGVVFDRGVIGGTAVQVKDSIILADQDGGVYQISNGMKLISPPDIQERIRKAIQNSQ